MIRMEEDLRYPTPLSNRNSKWSDELLIDISWLQSTLMYVYKVVSFRETLKRFFLFPCNSYSKPCFSIPKAECFNLGTIHFLGWIFFVRGVALCPVGGLAASPASVHSSSVAPLSCDQEKCLQTLTNGPWGAKSPEIDNHCPKATPAESPWWGPCVPTAQKAPALRVLASLPTDSAAAMWMEQRKESDLSSQIGWN